MHVTREPVWRGAANRTWAPGYGGGSCAAQRRRIGQQGRQTLCERHGIEFRVERDPAAAKTRQPELDAVPVPVLVIQGVRDPFGMPSAPPTGRVVQVAGDHSLKADRAAVAAAIRDWLGALISG